MKKENEEEEGGGGRLLATKVVVPSLAALFAGSALNAVHGADLLCDGRPWLDAVLLHHRKDGIIFLLGPHTAIFIETRGQLKRTLDLCSYHKEENWLPILGAVFVITGHWGKASFSSKDWTIMRGGFAQGLWILLMLTRQLLNKKVISFTHFRSILPLTIKL